MKTANVPHYTHRNRYNNNKILGNKMIKPSEDIVFIHLDFCLFSHNFFFFVKIVRSASWYSIVSLSLYLPTTTSGHTSVYICTVIDGIEEIQFDCLEESSIENAAAAIWLSLCRLTTLMHVVMKLCAGIRNDEMPACRCPWLFSTYRMHPNIHQHKCTHVACIHRLHKYHVLSCSCSIKAKDTHDITHNTPCVLYTLMHTQTHTHITYTMIT